MGKQTLTDEEKASLVKLEAANLDTMQAWQISLNLQDLFKTGFLRVAAALAKVFVWEQNASIKRPAFNYQLWASRNKCVGSVGQGVADYPDD